MKIVVNKCSLMLNTLGNLEFSIDSPRKVKSVSVDAFMPKHKHGMPTQTKTRMIGSSYKTEGILFQMPGYWNITFDIISQNGHTERAYYEIEVKHI